jgi:ABC-2 type transport system ATP-binding protein
VGTTPYRGKGTPPTKGDVEDTLGKVEGLKQLNELPTDDRAHAYEMVSEQDVDLRPELFRAVADKGWVLLELHRDAQTLEDVFRALTIGDERRNRQVGAPAADVDDGEDDADEEDEDGDDSDDSSTDDDDVKAAKADRS